MKPLILVVLLLLPAVSFSSDPPILHKAFLMYPSSFVNLTANDWKFAEEENRLSIALNVHQKSHIGQIFSARFINSDGGLEAIIIGSLQDLNLWLDIFDSSMESLLDEPLINENLGIRENNFLFDFDSHQLSYVLEGGGNGTATLKKPVALKDKELVVTLGGGQSSMIGCASLIAVTLNDRLLSETATISSKDVDECPAVNECSKMDCFKGICKLLDVPTCDCYRTMLTGPNCREPGQTARLINNDDEEPTNFIRFTPWPEARKVNRIAIDFKFADDEKEGVLVDGVTIDHTHIKIFVVGTKGQVVYCNKTQIDFDLHSDDFFHTIIVRFYEDAIKLLVDSETYEKELLCLENTFETIQFGAPIGLSSGVTEVGVTACLKEVYVDHHDILNLMYNEDPKINSTRIKPCEEDSKIPQDDEDDEEIESDSFDVIKVPLTESEPKKLSDCERMEASQCLNGGSCFRRSAEVFECSCKDGFIGKFCQFSVLPRSCAEASDFFGKKDGITMLDLDGSASIEPNVALCVDKRTVVTHNMRNLEEIRSSKFNESSLFVVAYKDFKRKQLQKLIKTSNTCHQTVTYTCDRAPLNFALEHTWFNTSFDLRVTKMDQDPYSCSCSTVKCDQREKCNCDANGVGTDTGTLTNRFAGITEIVTIKRENEGTGKLQLGDLVCGGYELEETPIRFVARTFFEISRDSSIRHVSFHFRTNDVTGDIFVSDNFKISIIDSVITATLNEQTVQLQGSRFSLERVSTISRFSFVDGRWHLLIVESDQAQIRVSVDKVNTILEGSLEEKVRIGGFIGCVRTLIVNGDADALPKFLMASDDIQPNCETHCSADLCLNGGECVEDFVNDDANCKCPFAELQTGSRCETEINNNSDVSLQGGKLSFDDIHANLTSDVFFSFRTDQQNALLFFAHDHNNNFLQVHLVHETQLFLILNNGPQVWSCQINALDGHEFADFNWNQIVVSQSDSEVRLHVNQSSCSVQAPRRLSTTPITRFEYSDKVDDVVQLPIGVHSQPSETPFTVFLLGGVSEGSGGVDGSLVLTPRYQTTLPNLLGCVRGVKVGRTVLDTRKAAEGQEGLKPHCDFDCRFDCANSGHCSVNWKTLETQCDCGMTSYLGANCDQDVGITGLLEFSIGEKLESVIIEEEKPRGELFKFAFSSSKSDEAVSIANVNFDDDRTLDVIRQPDGSISIQVYHDNGQVEEVLFHGDFADGYRHQFIAKFGKNSVLVSIDGKWQALSPSPTLNLLNATKVSLGSGKLTSGGCVSNVIVDFKRGNALSFLPISSFTSADPKLAGFIATDDAKNAQCPAFRVAQDIRDYEDTAQYPVWDSPFERHIYRGPLPLDHSKSYYRWLIYGLYILLVIFLLLLCCSLCSCLKRRRERRHNNCEDGLLGEPWRTEEPVPPPFEPTIKSDYAIPQPDVDLNKETTPRSSVTSGTSAYFTAQEPPSGDEFATDNDDDDSTIKNMDDEADDDDENRSFVVVRPEELPLRNPTRVSSFRGDPTPPKNSPLYSPKEPPRFPRMVSIPTPPPRTTSEKRMQEYLNGDD